MFKKILIANRGEIACRIIRSCKKLGIQTVAVYSDADAQSLHVQQADEAIHIGAAPSAESYLQSERIIAACVKTGAEAVHPGFGFLSENAKFATDLAKAGIVFIGPNIEAIGAMGDKIESKKLAVIAGVNTIPGYTEAIADAQQAEHIAADIGFPVMIKASAGGGGKGMRVVKQASEVASAFESASNEAQSSFGDARVFIEKYIEQPRHIEIQVLADQQGTCLHLGERECSIQRRHQKVIEEAPSPFLDAATRAAMGEQAIALAKAVNYVSAGTVEFIVDKSRQFYFLEMNTRLQVEHPVTELITGIDIVEWMIRVAAGEALPYRQDDVHFNGWAIEARVYAEDPSRNFMPSIGRITHYQTPEQSPHIRLDTGIQDGGEISMYYDPMIAKLVAYGANREAARQHLLAAIDSYCIRGVTHNLGFVAAILQHPRFQAGDLATDFIDREFAEGFSAQQIPDDIRDQLLVLAACLQRQQEAREAQISGQNAKPRELNSHYVARAQQTCWPLVIEQQNQHWQVTLNQRSFALSYQWQAGACLCACNFDGHQLIVQVERRQLRWRLSYRGYSLDIEVFTARAAELAALMPIKQAPDMSKFLLSPMPGLLLRLRVAAGDQVKAGQELAVVEAMKMENKLVAENDGTIAALLAKPGENLSVDQAIIEFE